MHKEVTNSECVTRTIGKFAFDVALNTPPGGVCKQSEQGQGPLCVCVCIKFHLMM
jgi:hypothetical protein